MVRRFVLLIGVISLVAPLGCNRKPPPAGPQVPEVTFALPVQREIQDYAEFTGRTDAIYTVDIRARVNGYLVKVNFKDGDIVQKDQLLYEIDPRPYQAQLDVAKGQVERLEGQKKLLQIQVDRYTKLVAKGAASQQDLDQYIGQQAENLSALAAAKAQVIYNDLNLKFCYIASPITGQVSRTFYQIGNLVTADNTLLTTVVSIDPMYAYFTVEEPTYLRIEKMMLKGILKTRKDAEIPVRMGLADDFERQFPFKGTFDFVNNIIDPTTGTITVRGVFPNPNGLLKPGLFARVRVNTGPKHTGLLVAERAIGTDQGQKFLYVIELDDEDNKEKVQYRRVKTGQMFDGLRAIEEGLKAGEHVVVNGLQRVRPGIEVKAAEVKMASLAAPPPDEKRPVVKVPAPKGASEK
jgi:RND family efflux transporter MFP subunit